MVGRTRRNCPVPECGAKYLVRLANHLADVHSLDIKQRRKYLQEARLQPRLEFEEHQNVRNENKNQEKAITDHEECSGEFKTWLATY